jgi:hypothetical protein
LRYWPGSLITFWTAGLALLWGIVELGEGDAHAQNPDLSPSGGGRSADAGSATGHQPADGHGRAPADPAVHQAPCRAYASGGRVRQVKALEQPVGHCLGRDVHAEGRESSDTSVRLAAANASADGRSASSFRAPRSSAVLGRTERGSRRSPPGRSCAGAGLSGISTSDVNAVISTVLAGPASTPVRVPGWPSVRCSPLLYLHSVPSSTVSWTVPASVDTGLESRPIRRE